MLVSRAEKLRPEEQQDTANPLHFGEVILYPNLGTPLHKSAMPALGLLLLGLRQGPGRGARARPSRSRAGERCWRAPARSCPRPDAKGRIQHAGALPLKGLAPGDYPLKVSVSDGRAVESRDASFTVVE